ncbi:MAG: 3-deoxy-7-phosphoheptulonate synthase [Candidatus Palauibacterales bacterium]|jgi:3-deoxy-7-phosphoheptulonate synthase|nr:3-deoxy-7-phosphoheptulonate synthase [Candidatus Palauibacterales bacterium]
MIAVLEKGASLRRKAEIVRFLEQEGFRVQVSETAEGAFVSIVGEGSESVAEALRGMPGVVELKPDAPGYPLVSRTHKPESTRVKVEDIVIGGREVVVIAGPCAVESREQILQAAEVVRSAGARLLRGGAFKPRSSPYSFQGLGERGLELLAEARDRTGLRVVTEVVAPEDVDLVAEHADVLQIGARNMHNYRLLSAVGSQPRPVLLKRGMMSTVDEMLLAAEYIVAGGNPRVILCERGIRTFETSSRNTLDLCAVPILKERTHLPVIVDPSHAAGRREWVPALARAAVAAGADGLIVEVHPDPANAASDGRQSLTPDGFRELMRELGILTTAVGRCM